MFSEPQGDDGTGPKEYGDGNTYFIKNVMDRQNPLDRRTSALDPFLNSIRKHIKPDFYIDTNQEGIQRNEGLTFIHRKLDHADIYFVTNLQNRSIDMPITFRIQSGYPQEWNPYTGEICPIYQYIERSEGIEIPLSLAPYESTFMVFEKSKKQIHVTQSQLQEVTNLTEETLAAKVDRNGTFYVSIMNEGTEQTKNSNCKRSACSIYS